MSDLNSELLFILPPFKLKAFGPLLMYLTSNDVHIESSIGNSLIWLWERSNIVKDPVSQTAGGTASKPFWGKDRACANKHQCEKLNPYVV
jgi:hypothetical protein